MNEMRVLILGGAAPYYPPRLTALWHSLGLMPRECPASAGRVTATAEGAAPCYPPQFLALWPPPVARTRLGIRTEVRTERHFSAAQDNFPRMLERLVCNSAIYTPRDRSPDAD